ncbi:MAG: DUF4491 family protein [Chloroflexi bacterium]|nr:MAG: DUF4491 family protein [Chloroflexota bacterium]
MINTTGLLLGLFMLFAIGFGFFWVIKVEYHLGARVWKVVLLIGVLLCLSTLFIPSFLPSALLGILGGSIVWGATELLPQEERVRRGLFPQNPRKGKLKNE